MSDAYRTPPPPAPRVRDIPGIIMHALFGHPRRIFYGFIAVSMYFATTWGLTSYLRWKHTHPDPPTACRDTINTRECHPGARSDVIIAKDGTIILHCICESHR